MQIVKGSHFVFFLLLGFSLPVQGQTFSPLVARHQTQAFVVTESGTLGELDWEESGLLFRDASGNEYRTKTRSKPGSAHQVEQVQLLSSKDRRLYAINAGAKEAIIMQNLPTSFPVKMRDVRPPQAEQILGTEIVEGLACTKLKAPASRQEAHNLSWISFEHDLIVRTEHLATLPNGSKRMIVYSVRDLQFKEPPAELMSVPGDYKVLDKVAASNPAQ